MLCLLILKMFYKFLQQIIKIKNYLFKKLYIIYNGKSMYFTNG